MAVIALASDPNVPQIAAGIGEAAMMQQRPVCGDARVLLGGAGLRGELKQVPVAAELGGCGRSQM